MARTSTKQLEIKLDKNGQRRGGKRKGAGRPKRGARASERHKKRPKLSAYEPVHVVIRARKDIGSLRTRPIFRAIKEATFTAFAHDDRAVAKPRASAATTKLGRAFHIVHLSIQRTHIHLIVEASDRMALARGMQAFGISAARHINAATGHRGSVFSDRYFPRVLKTPTQVRNCLAYVLKNSSHCTYSGRRGRRVAFPTCCSRTRLLHRAESSIGYRRPQFEDFIRDRTPGFPWPDQIDFQIRNGPGAPQQLHS
jgi:REP element-mobilizing transposase RayT